MKKTIAWENIRNMKYIRRTRRFIRRNKKSVISVASVMFVCIAIIFYLSISRNFKVPDVYLATDYNGSSLAVPGGYEWRYGYKHVLPDTLSAPDMTYTEQNILTTEKETQIVLSTKITEDGKNYPFSVSSLNEYIDNTSQKAIKITAFNIQDNELYINAPLVNGRYTYSLQLKYKRGIVNYGFKVIVTDTGSRTEILYLNRTDTLSDTTRVGAIIGALNLPAETTGLTFDSFNVKTKASVNDILIKYKTGKAISDFYLNSDNRTYFKKNAIILFTLIGNASQIEFRISDGTGSYDILYTRQEAEFYLKKDIAQFGRNKKNFTEMYVELNKSMIVTTYYLQAEMKGLELYVWKNKKLTGNNDTFYTLLIGTNRAKKESEIYDLSVAVKDIKDLNNMLARYNSQTYLSVLQMNKTDFTKEEMAKITDKIKFSSANFSKSIGLWEKTDTVAVKGYFPIANHNHFFSFDGKDFTPDSTFMFMVNNVSDLDKSTYFDVEAFCSYARSLSSLTEVQIQKILDYKKTITVGESLYINLLDLRKLGVSVTVGWTFNYGTPVTFYTVKK